MKLGNGIFEFASDSSLYVIPTGDDDNRVVEVPYGEAFMLIRFLLNYWPNPS